MDSISIVECGNVLSLRLARTANVSNRSGSISSHAAAHRRLHVAFDGARHGVIRDSRDSLQAPDRFFERRPVAQAHDEAVARLLDPLDWNSLKTLPQRGEQFSQKKTTVAALEPQLVIVNDDDRVAHADFSRFKQTRNTTPMTCPKYSSRRRPRVAVRAYQRCLEAARAGSLCVRCDNSMDTYAIGARLSTAPGVRIWSALGSAAIRAEVPELMLPKGPLLHPIR